MNIFNRLYINWAIGRFIHECHKYTNNISERAVIKLSKMARNGELNDDKYVDTLLRKILFNRKNDSVSLHIINHVFRWIDQPKAQFYWIVFNLIPCNTFLWISDLEKEINKSEKNNENKTSIHDLDISKKIRETPSAVTWVMEAIEKTNHLHIWRTMVLSLAEIHNQEAAAYLITLLDNKNIDIRGSAAEALMKYTGEEFLKKAGYSMNDLQAYVLIANATFEEDYVSGMPIASNHWKDLKVLGSSAINPLLKTIDNTESKYDYEETIRLLSAYCLAKICHPNFYNQNIIDRINKIIKQDTNEQIRSIVTEALIKLEGKK